jgi:signal transduction histidine kinase
MLSGRGARFAAPYTHQTPARLKPIGVARRRQCKSEQEVLMSHPRLARLVGALLAVANSGSMAPADEVGNLTQAFRRGGRARTGDGHGLGLAIVAAVAHAHHGQLTIEPIGEGGLRVEMRLPLAVNAVLDTPAVSAASGGGAGCSA